ncbi:hypothetical protein ACFX1X_006828 [Malus domestica]
MNLRHLISRQAVNNASKVSGTLRSLHAFTTIAADPVTHYIRPPGYGGSKPLKNPNFPKPISHFTGTFTLLKLKHKLLIPRIPSRRKTKPFAISCPGSCGSCDRSSPNCTRDPIRQPSTACC